MTGATASLPVRSADREAYVPHHGSNTDLVARLFVWAALVYGFLAVTHVLPVSGLGLLLGLYAVAKFVQGLETPRGRR